MNEQIRTIEKVLEDWYDSLPGCSVECCLACKRAREQKEQAGEAVKELKETAASISSALDSALVAYFMSRAGNNEIPQILTAAAIQILENVLHAEPSSELKSWKERLAFF